MKLKKFEQVIKDFSDHLIKTSGDDIKSLYLFGSVMIQEDFHFGLSDINTLIVFKDDADNAHITKVSEVYSKYNKFPFSVPLMFKEKELIEARDVFPIELIEIKEKNLLLYGNDLLKDMEFSLEDIRKQCESEVRAKVLGLRKMLFLKEDVLKNQGLLYKSLTSTIVLLKQAFRIKNLPIPQTRSEVLNSLAEQLNHPFYGIKNLYKMRQQGVKITSNIMGRIILDYINDLEFFSRVVNEEI